jgi:hypothetical protein
LRFSRVSSLVDGKRSDGRGNTAAMNKPQAFFTMGTVMKPIARAQPKTVFLDRAPE